MEQKTFNCVPPEIIRVGVEPYLDYRCLFNMAAVSKEGRPILKRNLIPRLRKACQQSFPVELLDCCLLTGGFLLSELTNGKFQTNEVDLVVDGNQEQAGQFLAIAGQTLRREGWEQTLTAGLGPLERYSMIVTFRKPFPLWEDSMVIKLYVPRRAHPLATAKDSIEDHALSISRIWFDGDTLSICDVENTLNLRGKGYKCYLLDYQLQDPTTGDQIIAMEKFTSTQQTKYMIRGYLMGLGDPEEEEEEEEED